MNELPGISIVVVVLNGIAYIEGCLKALRQQDYGGAWEIIFVDGGSTDGTQEFLAKQEGVRIVTNLDGIAASRNAGVSAAMQPFVAFSDIDCIVPSYWLSAFMRCFLLHDAPKLAGVGGSNIAVQDGGSWTAALSLMKDTFLGSNGSIYGKSFLTDRPIDHIPTINCLYRTDLLRKYAFLRKLHPTGEDAEITWRLKKLGYKFWYCTRATIRHHMRATVASWAKRMFDYGAGRLEVMRLHPDQFVLKCTLLAPMVLVALVPLAIAWPILGWLLVLYLALICIQSLWAVAKNRRPELFFYVVLAFIVTHIAYGLGMWRRLFTF